MSDKKLILFIVISAVLHVSFLVGSQMEWKKKKQYLNSDVYLLQGENKGTKINPPKKKKKKPRKVVKKVMEADPNALKTSKIKQEEEVEEGTFGQGGDKPLPYDIALNAWLQANKKYPKMARRLGHEGMVKVEFNVHPDGKLTDVILSEASDFDTLNNAAVKLVYAASPFRPFPEHFKKSPRKKIIPIQYTLR